MPTIDDVIGDALVEIRVARAGDVINAEDMALGLGRLNDLLDFWNAEERAVFTKLFSNYTLTPNHSPHTIGPAASAAGNTNPDFVIGLRPVELLFCSLNLGGNPAAYRPITVRDDDWYANQQVPDLTNAVPTDVYYSPDWSDPNASGLAYGALYFFGIPSIAYGVRLWTRGVFAAVALGQTFSQPPAYKRALTLTLAEWCANPFGQSVGPTLERQAREARATCWGANNTVPKIRTKDVSMPGGRPRAGTFNWRSRSNSGR